MTGALFDSPGKLLLLDREPPEPPRQRRKEAVEAQADRLRTLEAKGHIVKIGKCGVTVF